MDIYYCGNDPVRKAEVEEENKNRREWEASWAAKPHCYPAHDGMSFS